MTQSSVLYFATRNRHKVSEINALLPAGHSIGSLDDLGCTEELPETTGTIPGNALQKARYIHDRYGVNVFAEDTGLEVDALGGAPGADTAHYAGPQRDARANMDLLLENLSPAASRMARFRTVIALVLDGEEHLFEGTVQGTIAFAPAGDQGFGYDPIFIPDGYTQTFAQLDPGVKNTISHRGRAVQKLMAFLRSRSFAW